jgi:hypothetical protein
MLVVHLTADGIVLHCNPETVRVTGYLTGELVGKNFWATLFPGRLFAQVPKFIPASWSGMGGEGGGAAGGDGAAGVWGGPPPLMRDRPMTIRTRSGEERVVAFTRFEAARNGAAEGAAGEAGAGGARTLVCVGVDLTDRLLDADKADQPPPAGGDGPLGVFEAFAGAGGGGDDVVTPLAVSPPLAHGRAGRGDGGEAGDAVGQVHEFLTQVDERMAALLAAHEAGALGTVAAMAEKLKAGAAACGLLAFSARAEALHQAATRAALDPVRALVGEMAALYRPPTA